MDDPRELLVTPSESRFFKFSFPHSVTQVAVKSQSSDDVCLTLSIQHPQVGISFLINDQVGHKGKSRLK